MIAVAAHSSENDGDASKPEKPARRYARGVIVHAADGDITGKVKATLNCLLQAKRMATNLSCGNALLLKIGGKRHRLERADVALVEELPVKIARLHHVAVEQGNAADALAYQRGRDVGDD